MERIDTQDGHIGRGGIGTRGTALVSLSIGKEKKQMRYITISAWEVNCRIFHGHMIDCGVMR